MTSDKQLLEQALDFFQHYMMVNESAQEKLDPQGREILAAIRARLEQPEQEPVAWQERQARRMNQGVVTEWTNWYPCRHQTIDEARKEAPDHIPYEWRPLYTTPPAAPVQEPVALKRGECWPEDVMQEWIYWRKEIANGFTGSAPRDWFENLASMKLVDAPAAQRQWVGLTDEDVYPLANEHLHYQLESYEVSGIYGLARAIEAKLREKNGGAL